VIYRLVQWCMVYFSVIKHAKISGFLFEMFVRAKLVSLFYKRFEIKFKIV